MRSVAYALPVKDRAAGMKLVDALAGEHGDKYHKSRQAQGFTRIKVFLQNEPQEMVIFYLEGGGSKVHDAIKSRTGADDEFERWFEAEIEKVTGHHIGKLTAGQLPSELLYDWHPEKGVSRTHH